MTFPHRSTYVVGQQRRDPARSADESTAMATEVQRSQTETEGIQQELKDILTELSPVHGETAILPSKEDNMMQVNHNRKRLLEDPVFQGNEKYQRLLYNPVMQGQPATVDHYVCEWSKRRMLQKQQQPQPTNTGGGVNFLPSLTMSLMQVSPYAMELAARNRIPKKRASLTKLSKKLMTDWFEHNLHHPYPTEEEKVSLANEGGITLEQVNNWFINTRGRKWKPMINKLMAEKKAGNCSLFDKMVKKIEEPYQTL